MDLYIQFILLIYSFLIGIYLGVTYDLIYYFFLIYLHKIIKSICDIVFFIIQGFIIFYVIYNINNGIIPLYCYFIMGLGVITYYYFVSNYHKKYLFPFKKLVNGIFKKVIHFIKIILWKPFVDNYLFFKSIYKYLKKKLQKWKRTLKRKRIKIITVKTNQKTNTFINKKMK